MKSVEGANIDGNTLALKESKSKEDRSAVTSNGIYPLMFERPIDLVSGKIYSLVSEFDECRRFKRVNAKEKVHAKGGILFELFKIEKSSYTNVNEGQFPEFFFHIKQMDNLSS